MNIHIHGSSSDFNDVQGMNISQKFYVSVGNKSALSHAYMLTDEK